MYQSVVGRHLLKCKHEEVSHNLFALGVISPAVLNTTLTSSIESKLGQTSNVFIFKRIQINKDVIHSKLCLNISLRNSYTVYVTDAGFVEVKIYVKLYIKCPNTLFCSDPCTCKVPPPVPVGGTRTQHAFYLLFVAWRPPYCYCYSAVSFIPV